MEDRVKRLNTNDKINEVCYLLSSLGEIFSPEEKQQINNFKEFLHSKEDIRELILANEELS